MTVIAVRDGVMASDSRGQYNGIIRPLQKIFRRDDYIIGGAGIYDDTNILIDWFVQGQAGMPDYRLIKDDDADALLLVLCRGGKMLRVSRSGYTGDITSEFYAIGSGAVAATAAMEMGADAIKAAEIACRIDPDCGGPIQSMRFEHD